MKIPKKMQELWALADEQLSRDLFLQACFTYKAHQAGLCSLIYCYICHGEQPDEDPELSGKDY
jgi:hypothetical protein